MSLYYSYYYPYTSSLYPYYRYSPTYAGHTVTTTHPITTSTLSWP